MVNIHTKYSYSSLLQACSLVLSRPYFFSEWLNKSIQKDFLKKQTVKPWPTDKNGHVNRRSDDKQEGVKSIHGYQPHTSKELATPLGGD